MEKERLSLGLISCLRQLSGAEADRSMLRSLAKHSWLLAILKWLELSTTRSSSSASISTLRQGEWENDRGLNSLAQVKPTGLLPPGPGLRPRDFWARMCWIWRLISRSRALLSLLSEIWMWGSASGPPRCCWCCLCCFMALEEGSFVGFEGVWRRAFWREEEEEGPGGTKLRTCFSWGELLWGPWKNYN